MVDCVIVNNVPLHVTGFSENKNDGRQLIGFDFKVTNEEYHDITVLLYQNDFFVEIPANNQRFRATIYNYATSFTNLYEENAIGDFHLELIEKV